MPNIAVFIEQRDGTVKKVAWQMITEARRLVDQSGGEVWGVFLGEGADNAVAEAGKYGATKVFTATGDEFALYGSEVYGTALANFMNAQNPDLLMMGSTAMAFFAGVHHWWPKIFGVRYSRVAARIASVASSMRGMRVTSRDSKY